jgi:hypothetical protein
MYRAKTDLARHSIGLVYDTCPSPLQLPGHQPELPTPHSLPLPLVRLSYQSIRHETTSIHHLQPTRTTTSPSHPFLDLPTVLQSAPTLTRPFVTTPPSLTTSQPIHLAAQLHSHTLDPCFQSNSPNFETHTSHPSAAPPATPRHTHRLRLRLDKPHTPSHQQPAVWQTTTSIHTETATMNPHQKNKVDVSVRTSIPPEHPAASPSQPSSPNPTKNPPLTPPPHPPVPHRRRAKTLPPLRQTPLQKGPSPAPAERAQILRLGRLRPVQSRQIRQRARRRPRPRPPFPRHHPAPLAASLQLWRRG